VQELFEDIQHLAKIDDFEEVVLLHLHYEKFQIGIQESNK